MGDRKQPTPVPLGAIKPPPPPAPPSKRVGGEADCCAVCRRQSHAKWHTFCRGEINPVALIEYIEAIKGGSVGDVIIGYVKRVTGLDVPAMQKALDEERAAVR